LPDFHSVDADGYERLRAFGGRNVAGDKLDIEAAEAPRHLEHPGRVPVGGVEDEKVDAGCDQRLCTLDGVRPDADRGANPEATLPVLGRVGILDPLRDVLDGDQASETSVGVDDG
jgi:hypothetical protein